MEVRLIKSERQRDGSWQERSITLDKATWDRVRKQNNPNVKWELAPVMSPEQPKELITKITTKKAVSVEKPESEETPIGENNDSDEVDYSNYSLPELRNACRNAEIKFSNAEKEPALIAKLKKHESSSN